MLKRLQEILASGRGRAGLAAAAGGLAPFGLGLGVALAMGTRKASDIDWSIVFGFLILAAVGFGAGYFAGGTNLKQAFAYGVSLPAALQVVVSTGLPATPVDGAGPRVSDSARFRLFATVHAAAEAEVAHGGKSPAARKLYIEVDASEGGVTLTCIGDSLTWTVPAAGREMVTVPAWARRCAAAVGSTRSDFHELSSHGDDVTFMRASARRTPLFGLRLALGQRSLAPFQVDLNRYGSLEQLVDAVQDDDRATVSRILTHSPPLDLRSPHDEEETALIVAAKKGRDDVVRQLLAKGASPDVRDREDETALIEAAREGHAEVVRLLLDAGADASLRDNDGETAMEKADEAATRELLVAAPRR